RSVKEYVRARHEGVSSARVNLVRGDDGEALPPTNARLTQRGVRVSVTHVQRQVELLLVLHLSVKVATHQQITGAARHVEAVQHAPSLNHRLRNSATVSSRNGHLVRCRFQGLYSAPLKTTPNGAGLSAQQLAPARSEIEFVLLIGQVNRAEHVPAERNRNLTLGVGVSLN